MGRGASKAGGIALIVPNVPTNAKVLTDTEAQQLRDLQNSMYDPNTTAAVKMYISNTNFDGQGHSLSQTMNFLEDEGVDLNNMDLKAVNSKYGLRLTPSDVASMQYTSNYMAVATHALGQDAILQSSLAVVF